ncbi:hypothetical protein JOB18_043851 [Solea senegalensis]|uniref:Uncharacterized protein n=1 Tax=Solea senegalensis TaxID=28829 RepID=A0AAV6Q4R4_SOLSE|nr:hypothetical protein JOB18_043851 [Solea senegalensis]
MKYSFEDIGSIVIFFNHITGKISFSRAEELLNAIANDSDIEELSDGEESDPLVGEFVSRGATVEQPPDDSDSLSNAAEDADSDYLPSDADHISEDSDSDMNEPQH